MTTAKTMASVLAEHEMDFTYDGKQTGCSCGHWQARGPVSAHADHAAHQADALSAAGFGLVADTKAEAWDHGHHDGAVDAMLHMENDGAKTTPNPYRAAS